MKKAKAKKGNTSEAAMMLGISKGAVADIGGGTTGVSVIRDGVVTYSVDEPTGGTHMTLVVAGGAGLRFEEADSYKLTPENSQRGFATVRPVIEKMAQITKESFREKVDALYPAGGGRAGCEELREFLKRIPVSSRTSRTIRCR